MMADYGEILHKITPTQWVLIAGGGLGLGLLLRMRKKSQPAATSQGFDTSQYSGTGQTGYVQGNAYTPLFDPNQTSNAPTTPVPVTTPAPPTPPVAPMGYDPLNPYATADLIAISQMTPTSRSGGIFNPSPTPSVTSHDLTGTGIPTTSIFGDQHVQPGGNTGTLPTRSNIGLT